MLRTAKPFATVRMYDPAIDRSRTTRELMVKYALERDEKLLPIRPGAVPARFHVRRISQRLWAWVEGAANEKEMRRRAFRAAVIRVEHLETEGGARIDWKPAELKDRAGFDIEMSEAESEVFAPADQYEIGDAAYLTSYFPYDYAVTYRLLDSSVEVWDRMLSSQSADTSQRGVVPSNAEPKAPQEPSAAPSGDAPTAATVPAIVSSVESTSPPAEAPAAP